MGELDPRVVLERVPGRLEPLEAGVADQGDPQDPLRVSQLTQTGGGGRRHQEGADQLLGGAVSPAVGGRDGVGERSVPRREDGGIVDERRGQPSQS